MYLTYLIIFCLGAIPFMEVLGIIPIGVALGLPAVPVMIFAFAGNIFAIWLLIVMTSRVRGWLERRREKKGEEASKKREKRAAATWEKYGLPGLTMLAPILIGSHLGAILAISFGGARKQILLWMTFSLLFWTVTIGIASHYGMDFILQKTGYEGFFTDLLK